ncbi:MAG: hypothetical protein WC631_02875 [Candidatus Paceibacterota bacterium]|jgi:hypothetical protein
MIRFLGKSLSIVLILLVIFSLTENTSLAQQITANNISTIELNLSPSNPNPNEDIAISLSSDTVDLDRSTIYWYVDGIMRKSGTGEKLLNTQTGNSGKITKVRAVVSTPDGEEIERNLEINPTQVDLILETNSYIPPLYKGKAYFVSQGSVKIIAIPNIIKDGRKVGANNLNFKWIKDGIVLGDSSGLGKSVLIVNGSVPIKDINVSLDISYSGGNPIASQSINIFPSDPKIIFYENSPLYGILFNKAINSNYFLGNREELKVVAEPYFFNLNSAIGNDSTYSWSVNGSTVSVPGNKNELLLKQSGRTSGVASISLQIENLARIFQYAGNGFSVTFGE